MNFLKQSWKLLVIGTLVILLAGSVFLVDENKSFKKETVSTLSQAVSVAIATVDETRFERLSARIEDLQSPDYLRLRQQFVRLEDVYSHEGVRGFYAMKMDEGKIRFFADSAPVGDPWHSDPGVVYREPPKALLDIFKDAPVQLIGPYKDEFGSFYSFMAPVRNSSGKIVAVIGIDVSEDSFIKILRDHQWLPITITISVLLLYLLIVSLVVKNLNVFFSAKEKEDLTQEVKVMTAELNKKIAELEKEKGDLANFKLLTINREMKMVELKKEIELLKAMKDKKS